MASELRVNTLKDAAGSNEVAMTYVANGSAKAWAAFDMSGTAHIDEGLNTSSLTDNSTGDSTIAFSSSMNTATYCITISGDYDNGATMDNGIYIPSNTSRSSGNLRTRCVSYTGGANDNPQAYWCIMGDLA